MPMSLKKFYSLLDSGEFDTASIELDTLTGPEKFEGTLIISAFQLILSGEFDQIRRTSDKILNQTQSLELKL